MQKLKPFQTRLAEQCSSSRRANESGQEEYQLAGFATSFLFNAYFNGDFEPFG